MNESKRTKPVVVDLRSRLALRIPEAAAALGLSEGCFRRVLPEIERAHAGNAVLIPVAALERWLRDSAKADQAIDDRIVDELLNGMR